MECSDSEQLSPHSWTRKCTRLLCNLGLSRFQFMACLLTTTRSHACRTFVSMRDLWGQALTRQLPVCRSPPVRLLSRLDEDEESRTDFPELLQERSLRPKKLKISRAGYIGQQLGCKFWAMISLFCFRDLTQIV